METPSGRPTSGEEEDRADAGGRRSSGSEDSDPVISLEMRAIKYARVVVLDFMGGVRLPHPHDEETVADDAYVEACEAGEPDLIREAFCLRSVDPGRAMEARFRYRKIIRRVYDRARFTHKPNAPSGGDQATGDEGRVANGSGQRRRRIVPRDVNLSSEEAGMLSQAPADPHAILGMAIDVEEALGRLPPAESEITLDNLVRGKSVREIAERRGLTDKQVRGIIQRSKEKLAGILGNDYARD
jgi:hypothetical protein